MRSQLQIPFKPVGREMKEFTQLRISKEAIEVATRYIISKGLAVAQKAEDLAKHSGRKTVKKDDVILASEYI